MNRRLIALPMICALTSSVALAARPQPADDPESLRMIAENVSECVGVYLFLQRELTDHGKPGNGEAYGQSALGYRAAAEYLYARVWTLEHPGKNSPLYGHFGVNVDGRADRKRVQMRVASEDSNLHIGPDLERCKSLEEIVGGILPLMRADAGIE